jgi:hypothetical protein
VPTGLFFKADGTTVIGTFDTTNARFGLGTTPSAKLHLISTTEQYFLHMPLFLIFPHQPCY